ncbi:uncharacterized protein Z518_06718 [Rhinocladiella mackenziei CBS 650.93]|uniref:Rhinocladiella mackenziei CBS 650.93 unplaced genomic scaffold supercont1.5, whole genome shotgun sequence n=1 Tax=Rhinocladiella mackenziei CBS 650.93 TaxID=1442369 RepID=A0A0D2FMF1_9EURO|nr:uncharacterized protein Z518_06718 [Rhinocladiella mackenziei CBS 650.93]KIX03167.1 hypothetical protein Z518_06718 [Rhinocladiella mackenziei CBS 650.93]
MADDADFNSSDLEFESDIDDDPYQRYENAGRRTVEEILEYQAADRVASKKAAKTLSFARGAPGTASHRMSVKNAFLAFFKTIKHDPAQCPSGENIFRFIATIAARTRSRYPDRQAPGLRTIQKFWYEAVRWLNFEYPNVKDNYGPREFERIKTYLEQQVKAGKLSKGYWREKQWAGFMIFQKLVSDYMRSALLNGCNTWDIVILRLLGVALQVACSSRPGDVARTHGYDGLECLTWENVELTADENATSVQQLRAKLTLRFAKGQKDALNDDEIRFFDALENPAQSAACTIKLLLVHGLRQGICHGRTVQEVLDHTLRTKDRRVRWKHPKRPILCRIGHNKFLELDKPAGVAQIQHSLKYMSLISGFLKPMIPTDLRRGSARDTAHLEKPLRGAAKQSTSRSLGHSRKSAAHGITDRYAGPLQEKVFNLRAENPFKDRLAPSADERDPDEQLRPIRKEHIPKRKVDALLQQKGITDSVDKRVREQVTQEIRDRERTKRPLSTMTPTPIRPRSKKQKPDNGLDGTTLDNTDLVSGASRARPNSFVEQFLVRTPLAEQTASEINARPALKPVQKEELILDPALFIDAPADVSNMPAFSEDTDRVNNTPDEPVDDRVGFSVDERSLEVLQHTIFSQNANAAPSNEIDRVNRNQQSEIIDAMSMDALGYLAFEDTSQPWTLSGDDFVHYFATINIYRNTGKFDHSNPEEVAQHVPTGNSRNKPVAFLFHCNKSCGYSTFRPENIRLHEVRCEGPQSESDSGEGEHRCLEPDCGKVFKTPGSLRAHRWQKHRWEPSKCQAGCDPDISPIYQTFNEYKKHLLEVHDDLPESQRCPLVEECQVEMTFTRRNQLKFHLQYHHRLKNDEVATYVTPRQRGIHHKKTRNTAPRETTQCPIDDCESEKTFDKPSRLRDHLQKAHQMSALDATRLAEDILHRAIKNYKTTEAKKCPISRCKANASFSQGARLRDHFTTVHAMGYDAAVSLAEQTLGVKIKGKGGRRKEAHKCSVPDCKTLFAVPSAMRRHLTSVHSMPEDDARRQVEELFGS